MSIRIPRVVSGLIVALAALVWPRAAAAAPQCSWQYEAYVQDIGWQGLLCNGTSAYAGTQGQSRRIEALGFIPGCNVTLQAHVENLGWIQDVHCTAGQFCWTGTQGRSLRLEAVILIVDPACANQVSYRAYVENYGWLGWVGSGQQAGTIGQGLRMEAFQVW